MKESWSVCFLYRTVVGRFFLKGLVHPTISKIGGVVLSSHISSWIVPYYIRKHEIDMSDILIPEKGFTSFNDFFTRVRKSQSFSFSEDEFMSPCDGFLTPLSIDKSTSFCIKHSKYALIDLLQDEKLAKSYEDGVALVFRLTPKHYHRYVYAANGMIVSEKVIPGILHCVRPVALSTYPVFVQNTREYQVIETEHFGKLIQMEIGALMVGKIVNHKKGLQNPKVLTGEEKGYFEFGGSTIVLLFQKDQIKINDKLYLHVNEDGEVPVRLGDCIGWKLQ